MVILPADRSDPMGREVVLGIVQEVGRERYRVGKRRRVARCPKPGFAMPAATQGCRPIERYCNWRSRRRGPGRTPFTVLTESSRPLVMPAIW